MMQYEYKKIVQNMLSEDELDMFGAKGWKLQAKEGSVFYFMRERETQDIETKPLIGIKDMPQKTKKK